MGNQNSSKSINTESLADGQSTSEELIFKVDNINSYGKKHASAKIQVAADCLCIRQKQRQSLHIPLETIRRYGIDGSIFILECGRRAPLGQARYAFRCKDAQNLADSLDERIKSISKNFFEQRTNSSSTLTNVSSFHHENQIDQRRAVSEENFSIYSSSISIESHGTYSYRNSANDSEESDRFLQSNRFLARLNAPELAETKIDLNYLEFSPNNETIEHRNEENLNRPIFPYAYIDHEKTSTLQQIAERRSQQHSYRADIHSAD